MEPIGLQLALVVAEYGAVDGIVTLEDLLEDVVGEICGETDRDILTVQLQPDGSLLFPGLFPVHDQPEIGVSLSRRPAWDCTTIAGLVVATLGLIPSAPGETIPLDGWGVEVTAVLRHVITQVRRCSAKPSPDETPASAEDGSGTH